MRAMLGCTLGVLMVVSGGFADDKIDGKKLVGKWQPTEKTVTVEFQKEGKMVITVEIGGKPEKVEGKYKLDGNKLSVVVSAGGKDETDEVTIHKLTDEEMETESKGKKETLKRLK